MNKNEFLRRLEQELSVLDRQERKELLDFYEERFYNGIYYENKTEQDVANELEPPHVIARNILEQYGVSPKKIKTSEERYEGVSLGSIIWLAIVDLFFLSWLIPTLFSVTIGMFAALLGYIPMITLIIGEKTVYDVMVFGFMTGFFILLFHFALRILDLFIWVCRKAIMFHLNTFKVKRRKEFNKRLNKVHVDGFFKKRRLLHTIKRLSFIVALVLVGIYGFRIAVNADNIYGIYVNQVTLSEELTYDASQDILDGEAWTVETNLDNMKIVFVPSETNDIVLTREYQEENFYFEWSIDPTTNTIYVEQDMENDYWEFNWNLNLEEIFKMIKPDVITIEVPSDLVISVADLHTLNGTVEVSSLDLVTELDIDTANGAITLTDISAGTNILINTTNANIVVTDSDADKLDIQTSNGRITVKNSDFLYVDIDTSNGRIVLENINLTTKNGIDLEAETSNGDIELNNVYIAKVDLDTSNGDIEYNNEDTSFEVDYTRRTSNGKTTGNVN